MDHALQRLLTGGDESFHSMFEHDGRKHPGIPGLPNKDAAGRKALSHRCNHGCCEEGTAMNGTRIERYVRDSKKEINDDRQHKNRF